MRSRRYKGIDGESSSYDLSISDLMAALCCVFVLFTIGITTSLKEKNMAANQYNETKLLIYNEINDKMKDDIKKCKATFERQTLTIKFDKDDGFKDDSDVLQDGFKKHLEILFPKLIKILYDFSQKGDGDEIEEIRIEGFTATDSRLKNLEGGDYDYKTGIELSQKRTMNVLTYCLETDYLNMVPLEERDVYKDWVRKHMSASGYSFSRPYWLDEAKTKMDKEKTRRVEIRIKTNADKVIEKYQTKNIEEFVNENE